MANKRVKVIKESVTGKNEIFKDNYSGQIMTKKQFLKEIKNNNNDYQDKFHIRNINGVDTPCSNPDSTKDNNLG